MKWIIGSKGISNERDYTVLIFLSVFVGGYLIIGILLWLFLTS